MSKFATTLLIILSLILVNVTGPANAQPSKATSAENNKRAEPDTNSVPDLKSSFAIETKKLKAGSVVFDPIKIDRENARRQAAKKGFSTKDKLFLVAFIVGIAAIVFFVVKYGKDCIRSSPPDCNPVIDENCICEEYARRNP